MGKLKNRYKDQRERTSGEGGNTKKRRLLPLAEQTEAGLVANGPRAQWWRNAKKGDSCLSEKKKESLWGAK